MSAESIIIDNLWLSLNNQVSRLEDAYESYEPEKHVSRNTDDFGKKHKEAKDKHKQAKKIYQALKKAENPEDFNGKFFFLSPELSIQRHFYRFQESKKLTKSEEILRDLRELVNGKNDMFVEVMHRLCQRSHTLSLEESCQEASRKQEAFDILIDNMRQMAGETNSMVYYYTIVQWETKHRETIKIKRGFSFFQPTSVNMLESLKKDLLNQALKNGDIKMENKTALRVAMNANDNTAELRILRTIFPDRINAETTETTETNVISGDVSSFNDFFDCRDFKSS